MSCGTARTALGALLGLTLLASAGAAQAPPLAPSPVRIAAALPGSIRVVLAEKETSQFVGGKLQWLDGTQILGTTSTATEVVLAHGKVRVRLDGKARDAQRLVAVPLSGHAVFDQRSFRGRFEFFAGRGGGVVVLNVLPLEDYLQGVVPSEMPSSWHPEALKAQAVAARTYAVSRLDGREAESYDVVATVMDQVYRGVAGETEATNLAVRETAGQVLLYDGAPISAMFCSDAGGCTLGGSQPYLQAVSSFNPASKHNHWEFALPVNRLIELAKADGSNPGQPQRVIATNDPVSGHLLRLEVAGSKGSWSISGTELRRRLGYSTLKSTRALLYAAQTPGDPPPVPVSDPTGIARKCFNPGYWPEPEACFAGTDEAIDIGAARAPLRGGSPASPSSVAPSAADSSPRLTEIMLAGADELVLVGSGYGHGLGMSQYGAAELARQGWSYRDILLYFYRGVELAALPAVWLGANKSAYQAETAAAEGPVDVGFYAPFSKTGS